MTHTTKHTPGPWKLDIYEEQNADKHYFFKQDDKGEEDIIFSTSFPSLRDEDAHLIAAAPAMYEALRQAYAYLAEMGCDCEEGKSCGDCIVCQCETALAQAEGRDK